MIPGTSAIGRIAAVGPDATSLKEGQLVYVDCFIRGRDDQTAVFLGGVHEGYSPQSQRMMRGEWRDSTFCEYAKMPLETLEVLDESKLLGEVSNGGLGYKVEDLAYLGAMLVPYGGLNSIGLKSGETIVIGPATGGFGGAAVLVALAMGARVIAMGRNKKALEELAKGRERVETVAITGDMAKDLEALKAFGTIDAFLDISPPEASKSTHIKSAILALRHSGRVSLMGGTQEDVALPHSKIMHFDIALKGKYMYDRDDIKTMIKMIQVGVLPIGEKAGFQVTGKFGLEDWDAAFTSAAENATVGKFAVFTP